MDDLPAAPPGNRPALQSSIFDQVPVEIIVSVGKARPRIRDLLQLRQDAVLPLDRLAEDPVELYVGDRLIGRGQLEELPGEGSGQLAVRLTEIADPGGIA